MSDLILNLTDLVSKIGKKFIIANYFKDINYLDTFVSVNFSDMTRRVFIGKLISDLPLQPFNDNSCVAFLKFEHDLNDELGNSVSSSGSVSYVEGIGGLAVNGNGNQITINNLPFNNDSDVVTVSAFIWWNGNDGVMPFGWYKYDIYFYNNNFGFNTSNGDVYGISSLHLYKQWVHIIVEFRKGAYGKIWINGIPQQLSQKNNSISTSNAYMGSSFHIFGWGANSSYRNFGYVDTLRIFNRSLSDDEAKKLYQIDSQNFSDPHKTFIFFDDFYNLDNWDVSTRGSGGYNLYESVIRMYNDYSEGENIRYKNMTFTLPLYVVWKGRCSTQGDIDLFVGAYKDSSHYIMHILENDSCSETYCSPFISYKNGSSSGSISNNQKPGNIWKLCQSIFKSDKTIFKIYGLNDIVKEMDFSYLDQFKIAIGSDTDSSGRFGYIDYLGIGNYIDYKIITEDKYINNVIYMNGLKYKIIKNYRILSGVYPINYVIIRMELDFGEIPLIF